MAKNVVGSLWTWQNESPHFICRGPLPLINEITLQHFSYKHSIVPIRETHDRRPGLFVDTQCERVIPCSVQRIVLVVPLIGLECRARLDGWWESNRCRHTTHLLLYKCPESLKKTRRNLGMQTGVIIAIGVCCCLLILGTVLGIYFSGVTCPDFGSDCSGSPGTAGSPGSPGSAATAGSPGTARSPGSPSYRAPGAPGLQSLGSTPDSPANNGPPPATCPSASDFRYRDASDGLEKCASCEDSSFTLITEPSSSYYLDCRKCETGYQLITAGANAGKCCLGISNGACACPTGSELRTPRTGALAGQQTCASCANPSYEILYPVGHANEGQCVTCQGNVKPTRDAAGNPVCPTTCPSGYVKLANVPWTTSECFKCENALYSLQTDPSKANYGNCIVTQQSATTFFTTPTTNPAACPTGQTLSGFGVTSCVPQPASAARSTTPGACPYVDDRKVTEGARANQCVNCGSPFFFDVLTTGANAGTCQSKFTFQSVTVT